MHINRLKTSVPEGRRRTQSGKPRCALTGGCWIVWVLTLGYRFNISRSPTRRAPYPLSKCEETKASGTVGHHGRPHGIRLETPKPHFSTALERSSRKRTPWQNHLPSNHQFGRVAVPVSAILMCLTSAGPREAPRPPSSPAQQAPGTETSRCLEVLCPRLQQADTCVHPVSSQCQLTTGA